MTAAPVRRPSAAAAPRRRAGPVAVLLRHPGRVIGCVIALGAASTIALNALSFQTARHPAPLFGPAVERPPSSRPPSRSAPADPAATPLPPARPAASAPASSAPGDMPNRPPLPRDGVGDPVRTASPAAQPVLKAAPPRDPIGDLIRAGATGTTGSARPVEAKPDSQRLVAAAQRTLGKLGYGPLVEDGLMGPATRGAIERFERDRRLPVTGELGPRVLRELSAQAGTPIE